MKKLLMALLAIFAVAGVANVDAACCGCPVKSTCPEKKPCCKRESKCPKCSFFVSKCGCKSADSDDKMLDLEEDSMDEIESLDESDAY